MSAARRSTPFPTTEYLEGLLDLILLGLSWVQKDDDVLAGSTAHSILSTMIKLGVVNKRELDIAEADYRTATFFMQKLFLQLPAAGSSRNPRTGRLHLPPQTILRNLVWRAPEPAVALIDTRQLVYRSLIGRQYGYRLLITKAGRQRAMQ